VRSLLSRALIVVFATSLLLALATGAGSAAMYDVQERVLGERVLARGSWGADVFTLQLHLREIGYDLAADGLYGSETESVVKAFQRDYGLPVTGRVDKATLERLALARVAKMETMDYVVQPGDSLWAIARAFETTMELLVEINDLPDRPLRAGETIKVPALLRHEVKPGDTLWDIARKYQTDVDSIAKLNGISPDEVLRVGTVLLLPRGAILVGGTP